MRACSDKQVRYLARVVAPLEAPACALLAILPTRNPRTMGWRGASEGALWRTWVAHPPPTNCAESNTHLATEWGARGSQCGPHGPPMATCGALPGVLQTPHGGDPVGVLGSRSAKSAIVSPPSLAKSTCLCTGLSASVPIRGLY